MSIDNDNDNDYDKEIERDYLENFLEDSLYGDGYPKPFDSVFIIKSEKTGEFGIIDFKKEGKEQLFGKSDKREVLYENYMKEYLVPYLEAELVEHHKNHQNKYISYYPVLSSEEISEIAKDNISLECRNDYSIEIESVSDELKDFFSEDQQRKYFDYPIVVEKEEKEGINFIGEKMIREHLPFDNKITFEYSDNYKLKRILFETLPDRNYIKGLPGDTNGSQYAPDYNKLDFKEIINNINKDILAECYSDEKNKDSLTAIKTDLSSYIETPIKENFNPPIPDIIIDIYDINKIYNTTFEDPFSAYVAYSGDLNSYMQKSYKVYTLYDLVDIYDQQKKEINKIKEREIDKLVVNFYDLQIRKDKTTNIPEKTDLTLATNKIFTEIIKVTVPEEDYNKKNIKCTPQQYASIMAHGAKIQELKIFDNSNGKMKTSELQNFRMKDPFGGYTQKLADNVSRQKLGSYLDASRNRLVEILNRDYGKELPKQQNLDTSIGSR